MRWDGGSEETRRESKDRKINKEERRMVDFIGERGWIILNGGARGDEEGRGRTQGEEGNR